MKGRVPPLSKSWPDWDAPLLRKRGVLDMETQATPRQCSANVHRSDGLSGGTPCMNKGKLEERGKWWCNVHTQSAQRRREEKSKARWDKESARLRDKNERAAEMQRRAGHFDALVEALEGLLQFRPAIENTAQITERDRVVDQARAALDEAKEGWMPTPQTGYVNANDNGTLSIWDGSRWQPYYDVLAAHKALAKSHDALVEALRGLLPINEEGKCSRCAEGIERNDDMYHWDTGYIDNRCLDHDTFSRARAALDAARLSGTSENEG